MDLMLVLRHPDRSTRAMVAAATDPIRKSTRVLISMSADHSEDVSRRIEAVMRVADCEFQSSDGRRRYTIVLAPTSLGEADLHRYIIGMVKNILGHPMEETFEDLHNRLAPQSGALQMAAQS